MMRTNQGAKKDNRIFQWLLYRLPSGQLVNKPHITPPTGIPKDPKPLGKSD
jgi:hypothetical protein